MVVRIAKIRIFVGTKNQEIMYKVRAILDTKEDVLRTLLIDENKSLEHLHTEIAKAFGFDGQEMASFYTADNEWNQGEEIPLFSMAEAGEGISMANAILKHTLPQTHDKLIYVYDFFNMWTFYVEVIEISDEQITEPKVILSFGTVPDEAPEKNFENTSLSDDFDDEFDDFNDDGFDEFDSLDDLDLDNI